MFKLSIGFMVLLLPVVMLFQNCGKQGASALSSDDVSPDNVAVNVDGGNNGSSSSGTISTIDFGYDAISQGFLYSLILKEGRIVDAQGGEIKMLSNTELSAVVNVIAGNRLVQEQTDSSCAIGEVAQPVFAQLNLDDNATQFILNTARKECGLVNFVDGNNTMLDLSGLLDDLQAEIETP